MSGAAEAQEPTNRIVMGAAGGARRILRIDDRGRDKGSILYLQPTPFKDADGIHWEPSEQHYSIHPPTRGEGTTIKQTIRIAGGRSIETAQFVKHHSDPLRTIVYGAIVGMDHYKAVDPKRLALASSFGNIDQWKSSLLYVVYVEDVEEQPRYAVPSYCRNIKIRTTSHRVIVFYTVAPIPSPPSDVRFNFITSEPRIDGGEIRQNEKVPVSYSADEVGFWIDHSFHMLAGLHMQFLQSYFEQRPDGKYMLEQAEQRAYMFGVDVLEQA